MAKKHLSDMDRLMKEQSQTAKIARGAAASLVTSSVKCAVMGTRVLLDASEDPDRARETLERILLRRGDVNGRIDTIMKMVEFVPANGSAPRHQS